MKALKINYRHLSYLIIVIMLIPISAEAQKMRHKSGGNLNRGEQNISRTNVQQKKTINGGHQKSTNRDFSNMNTTKKSNLDTKRDINKTNIKENKKSFDRDKVNIDNSKRNINIDNSKIKRDLGINFITDFEAGLIKTIDWAKNYFTNQVSNV